MSNSLILVVTLVYILTACSLAWEEKGGMSLMFIGYALANVGVIWANR